MENEGIVLNAYVKKMPSFISTYDEDNVSHESSEVGAPSTDFVQGDRETKVCVPESVLELHNHRLENKDNVERDRKTTAVDILRRNFGRSRSRRNFSFTEDYREPEDVVVSISNMQMGHSETSEEHPKNNGQVEVKLQCQSKSELSDEEEVDIRANDSGETFECKVEPIEEGSTRELKQHVYCSVYCIANDSYRNSVDNTAGEEENRTVTPSTSNTSLEQNTQSLQSDSELRGYPEPFTLADLVDATTLNNFYNGESSLSVLTCRICLEDKQIKPLLCCKRAVCEECLDTYISSQVRVGRVAIACPITECSGFLEESVVVATLAFEDVAKYKYFLELSRLDAGTKPCPQCNLFTSLKSRSGEPTPIRIENKYKIQCSKCQFVWCFRCHAPWHDGLKCRDYRKGDKLLRDWAGVIEHGQRNAQKCPRCKIHIQRTEGCDHMTCTQCNTNFCYRCGERYRHLRFFGDHTSDLSVFGCKYRYLPDKPHLRRFVRGSVCALLIFPIYCCKKRRKRPQGTEYWLS
ncbi:probable E3 ubiquitin-protein ligase RNF217 isoform X2 [Clupea harengus]|uniref:E3 ubiquitin-protein ligase RNF217 n=1 Tax=Clupea harengus TaxID=7950 RepID=A0A6P8GPV1_CLUHA|nr:probable E3 ubiquitin-protein ligase RNF217 isoform X2 [Clupea harengus]